MYSNEKPTLIFPKIRKPKAFILAKQKYLETACKEMGGLEIIKKTQISSPVAECR
jgi:hypothetical protein